MKSAVLKKVYGLKFPPLVIVEELYTHISMVYSISSNFIGKYTCCFKEAKYSRWAWAHC